MQKHDPEFIAGNTLDYAAPIPVPQRGRGETLFALALSLSPFLFYSISLLPPMTSERGSGLGYFNLLLIILFGSVGSFLAAMASILSVVFSNRWYLRAGGGLALVVCGCWIYLVIDRQL